MDPSPLLKKEGKKERKVKGWHGFVGSSKRELEILIILPFLYQIF